MRFQRGVIHVEALTLSDNQARELQRLLRFYQAEAQRCHEAKANLAGIVMAGAALETALILMIDLYPDEALATGKCPGGKKGGTPLIAWRFDSLLSVAKAANWLPTGLTYGEDDWNAKKANIGDYAEVVRETRNLAHPARHLQDHRNKRVTRRYLEFVLDAVELSVERLLARVERSLCEQPKEEEGVQTKGSRTDN